MTIALIIQARMNSKRLPNKVLMPINGKPIIDYLIEQIKHKNPELPIIVATSRMKADMDIVEHCQRLNIDVFQGSLENVSSRFFNLMNEKNLKFCVRVCADSPLLDGRIISNLTKLIDSKVDIVTNVHPRTFPKGLSVEIINCKTFISNYNKLNSKQDFEHVTRYFYNNSENFNIVNVSYNKNLSSMNLAIDTSRDFKRISKIIRNFKKEHYHYSFKDIIDLYNHSR